MSINVTQLNKQINNLLLRDNFQKNEIHKIIKKNKKNINCWFRIKTKETTLLLDAVLNNKKTDFIKLLIEEGANPFIRSPIDNSSILQKVVEEIETSNYANEILNLLEIILFDYQQQINEENPPFPKMHLKKSYYEALQLHNITPNLKGEDIFYQINNLKNNFLKKKLLILFWTPEIKNLSLHDINSFFHFHYLISKLNIPIIKDWNKSDDEISTIVTYKLIFKNKNDLYQFKNKIKNIKKIIIEEKNNILFVKYLIDKSIRWKDLFIDSFQKCNAKSKSLAEYSEKQNTHHKQIILQTNRTHFPYNNNFQQGAYFDQSDYTVGNLIELNHSIIYPSLLFKYQKAPISQKLDNNIKNVIKTMKTLFFNRNTYQNLTSKSAHHTIHYMFKFLKKGIFVVIKNTYLESFVPFSRANFTNFYYPSLYISEEDRNDLTKLYQYEKELEDLDKNGNNIFEYQKKLETFLLLEEKCIQNFKTFFKNNKWFSRNILWNRRKWLANNHFIKPEFWEGDKDIVYYRFLLEELIQRVKLEGRCLPDAIFCLNLRDCPVLKVDETAHKIKVLNPYPAVTESYNNTLLTLESSMIPILSHSGHNNYHDIPLPTTDDIEYHSQQFFISNNDKECSSRYHSEIKDLEWKDKINKAVFRGTATGDGITPETNLRMKATLLSNQFPELLNVGLTAINQNKIRVNSKYGLLKINKKELLSKYKIDISNKLDLVERQKYKYNLCLDGHTRADRFGNEMRLKNIMILPNSGHFLWFEPFMCPIKWTGRETTTFLKNIKIGTHFLIEPHLKDLLSLIKWCQNHDSECQIIVNNMIAFHRDFLDRRSSFMYHYMEGIIRCISNNCLHVPFTLPKQIQLKSSLVGLVVGYRSNSSREKQLIQFMKFMNRYRNYIHIVIVEQYDNHYWLKNKQNPFNIWWNSNFKEKLIVHSDDFIKHYQNSNLDKDNPNIKINCNLAGGIQNIFDKKLYHKTEYETKLVQSKFNLGLLKNIGFNILEKQIKKLHKNLSHVIFIDIDILPDIELEPFFFRKPPSNSIISLATRGTAYEHFSLETMVNERPFHNIKHSFKNNKNQNRKFSIKNKLKRKYSVKNNKLSKKRKGGKNQNKLLSWLKNKLKGKFSPFFGAAISFDINLFKKINGYPNHFWGWGGEDDALIYRIVWLSEKKKESPLIYIPSRGRLIDLEATPNLYQDTKDKTTNKNKEYLKWEKMNSLRNFPEGLIEIQNNFQIIDSNNDNHCSYLKINPFFENALLNNNYQNGHSNNANKNNILKDASHLMKYLNI